VVEQDQFGIVLLCGQLDLFDLAATDEVARVGCLAGAADDGDDVGAGGGGELLEFVQTLAFVVAGEIDVYQDGPLPRLWAGEQGGGAGGAQRLPSCRSSSALGRRILRAGTMVDMACL
jgi:hypothetical protein